MISSIQVIALWPAEWIVRLVLMLFGIELAYLPHHWQVISIGFVGFVFWWHLIRGVIAFIKRRVFGFYGNGG
ncbi:hypothetical protein CBF23_003145 [Marinomonas agarivorans]|nr:hypothetical protein CBF23_003145 [Marinomonas agarivorans]